MCQAIWTAAASEPGERHAEPRCGRGLPDRQTNWTESRSFALRARSGDGVGFPAMSERSVFREYLEALLIAAVFLGFSNTFVVKTFYIPSGSMENTLLIGDHLFVNRYIFGSTARGSAGLLPERDIRRGDVVIFRSVEDPQTDLVKRCIGMPGDVLQMREKVLTINGKQVDDTAYALYRDPRVFTDREGETPDGRRRDNFGPITVPEGRYFCMGDNRDQPYASRFWR